MMTASSDALAEDRFHVTTTTGGAPRVMHHMEDYLQTEFPHLKVWLTSTTEQWAVIAVQGPKAREIIAPLVDGIDLSNEAMPHMSVRRGQDLRCADAAVPDVVHRRDRLRDQCAGRLRRRGLGRALGAAEPLGACAYGTETMHVLRAEKGYIIVGQDTDGTVTPDDAGLNWAVGEEEAGFCRHPRHEASGSRGPGPQAACRAEDEGSKHVLEEGAQIVADPNQSHSDDDDRSCDIVLLVGELRPLDCYGAGRRTGGRARARPLRADAGQDHRGRSHGTVFFDKEGVRLNG
jgi:sarcosine oxidase subunit alpha